MQVIDSCKGFDPTNKSQVSETAKAMNGIAKGAKAILTTMNDAIDSVVGFVENVANAIKDTIDSTIQGIHDEILKFLSQNEFIKTIKSGIDSVANFIGDIVKTISDVACAIADAIGSLIDEVVGQIQKIIADIMKGLMKVMEAIDKIMNAIRKIIESIMGVLDKLLNAIFGAIGEFIDGAMDYIDGILKKIFKPAEDCGKALSNSFGAIAEIEQLSQDLAAQKITPEEYDSRLQEIRDTAQSAQTQ